eukprot:11943093-Karenia_brevis.AAC.1
MSEAEKLEILLKDHRTQISFVKNPHRGNTKAHDHFDLISSSTTVGEAKGNGASLWDLRGWARNGSMVVESAIEGGDAMEGSKSS